MHNVVNPVQLFNIILKFIDILILIESSFKVYNETVWLSLMQC